MGEKKQKQSDKRSDNFSIGVRIKRYRKRKGLTQAELAEKLGLSQITISHYETGDISPSLERINAINNVLECDLLKNTHYKSHPTNYGSWDESEMLERLLNSMGYVLYELEWYESSDLVLNPDMTFLIERKDLEFLAKATKEFATQLFDLIRSKSKCEPTSADNLHLLEDLYSYYSTDSSIDQINEEKNNGKENK